MADALFSWISNCGVGIQSSFAWAQFNQSAYVANVALRQNQIYQKKNYNISWVAMARGDIRDMMSISVARINNYMTVSALILGCSSSALFGVTFRSEDPPFLQLVFMMSVGMSVVFLMLAIFLGVKGQNSAFSNTMKLLTYEVRPENPADYNHDYMKTAQWVEQQGIGTLFRIPGFMPGYYRARGKKEKSSHAEQEQRSAGVSDTSSSLRAAPSNFGAAPSNVAATYSRAGKWFKQSSSNASSTAGEEPHGQPCDELNMPSPDSLENLDVQGQQQLWYLFKFSHFMRLWMPFDVYCKFAMSLGVISLGQGSMYFCLTKMFVDHSLPFFAVLCVTFPFLYFPMMVISENFKFPGRNSKAIGIVLQILGPLFGTVGVVFDEYQQVEVVCVPMCFLSHAMFYAAVFFVAYSSEEDGKLPAIRTEDVFSDLVQEFDNSFVSGNSQSDEANVDADAATLERGEMPPPPRPYNYNLGHVETAKLDDGEEHTWEHDSKYKTKVWKDGVFRASSSRTLQNGMSAGWPTDSEFFGTQVESLARRVRHNLRNALLVAVSLYFLLFCWSALEIYSETTGGEGLYKVRSFVWPRAVCHKELKVSWGDEVFRPHTLACSEQHIFVSDRFRIFELINGKLVPRPCKLQNPIVDVVATCDDAAEGGACSIYALIPTEEAGFELVECDSGIKSKLLQASSKSGARSRASMFTQWKNGVAVDMLQTIQDGELIEYKKSDKKADKRTDKGRRWEPQWTLGGVVSKSSRAVSATKYYTMVFQNRQVQVHNATSMERIGLWILPASIGNLSTGCGIPGTAKSLVLSYEERGSVKPRLTELSLPGFDQSIMHRRPASQLQMMAADMARVHRDSKAAL